jgi:excinuclease ABC subunit B
MKFKLHSKFSPTDKQQESIDKLVKGNKFYSRQTLLGTTGVGKTFIIANVIEKLQKKTIILAHNKTLAAQLYQELKQFFPENRVEYFISYYDYYQPESYIPTTDTYIDKEATINTEIEKMRLKAAASLLSRDDVIVIASISCIYGAGNPKDYQDLSFEFKIGEEITRQEMLLKLVDMQYQRNDSNLENGNFRVRGDVIDVMLGYHDTIVRIEIDFDEISKIYEIDPVTKNKLNEFEKYRIYPAKQFVVPDYKIEEAKKKILKELEIRKTELNPLEEERLTRRVKYDMEMIEEVGYCTGIENYSRHFDGRKAGVPPHTLLDYMGDDFLFVIDESHQTIPQAHGMYNGDKARKKNLIDFGFRLPSAYDNRPLKFVEMEKYFKQTIFVSATPADYEIETSGQIVEQIIRPTGLLDPTIEIKPEENQIEDLIKQIKITTKNKERTLVTTLTKRMAEDLTNYLAKQKIKVRYMHSDIDTLDRTELIRQLRAGEYDVLVGINLLREGLDIPEVSLIAILDADKEGFLRNERSLIQTIGRAARNENGRVIMYANKTTKSMKQAIDKTNYRRKQQIKYNKKHNITPKTIIKEIPEKKIEIKSIKHLAGIDIKNEIIRLENEMKKAAEKEDFETAIKLRDYVKELKNKQKYKK